MTVSFGKYLINARSTSAVKLKSSIIAWAFACLAMDGVRKRVIRCLLLVVILHIVQLIEVYVKYHGLWVTPNDHGVFHLPGGKALMIYLPSL